MDKHEFTARGRAIGAELRVWRERAGLESKELARSLSWSASKVSNMEAGRRGVSEVDAAMYLACCRAPGDDIQQVLEFFHEQEGSWLQPHGSREAVSGNSRETGQHRIERGRIADVACPPGK